MARVKVAVFVSGGGSNLQALIEAAKDPAYPAEIALVVANTPDAYGLERAKQAAIPAVCVPHKDHPTRQAFEEALLTTLATHHIDLICLAGFMRVLSAHFLQPWEGRILNIHPSLLPAHKGLYGQQVHQSVLAAKDPQSGCTVHYVTEGVDEGPIVLQTAVPVEAGDNVETLAARVLQAEHTTYPTALKMVAEGLKSLTGTATSAKV